ncbi:4-alpha-glucanotransferase [Desulfovermiculus halophilus]|uniref:4-alpha-glucanotransferase n=1 Tax=Desulfovermiculus halophilus TaxID=339722 RepID=UPI000B12805B|nr:4-alpha-glucanotransferase [Desulfovermiculus halophilus]
MSMNTRRSGILLHPTSLPGPHGIGDLGPAAYRFVDCLVRGGQTLWQVLPLGPTGYGNSPYMCLSAFAGNPLLINLELVAEEGLLTRDEIQATPRLPAHSVDYGRVQALKRSLLAAAYNRFTADPEHQQHERYASFCHVHTPWLQTYALFMALKEAHENRVWTEWEPGAAHRDPSALEAWQSRLEQEIGLHKYMQFLFFEQWTALKNYCHRHGVSIIGDLPLYVAYDSAEVWSRPDLFHLDPHGRPPVIAGVPPDYFSSTGQRWGNPIYRWTRMAESGYAWWIERFRLNLTLFDILRIDHFRGFEAYWEVPAEEETAANGRWVKGPGQELFKAVQAALGPIQVIAEDLGVITPEVDALRDALGFPGMRILQMAFGNDPKAAEYRPHNHIQRSVVYTATHDHNTSVGWFTSDPGTQSTQSREEIEAERRYVLDYLGTNGREIHWDLIRLALGSVAATAVFPLQDVLGLGTQARMNLPGSASGNWEWRFTFEQLTSGTLTRLRRETEIFERI